MGAGLLAGAHILASAHARRKGLQFVPTLENVTALAPATTWLQRAIDDAAAAGGGRVAVPAGVYRTGSLQLRSHVELHLEAGATLQLVPEPELYPPVAARWEGAPVQVHRPGLYAYREQNVAITGFGTIDGAGASWWERSRDGGAGLDYPRPTLIGLHECTRVTIRDLTLRNSPSWTVHPLLCENVTVTNVQIDNPADSPNTDGINPESCRNVRISDCHIDVGDDCIAIKAGTERAPDLSPCENIAITNCTMVRGHGGVVLGSEMSGSIRNVVISNCLFSGTDRGVRIKTRRGRGGTVEDLRVTNVIMDGVGTPIAVNPFYFCGPDGKAPHVADRSARPVEVGTPQIRRLHLAHLSARNTHACAGFLSGLPEAPLTEVTISDVAVSFAADPQPEAPDMAAGLEPVTRAGLQLAHLRDSEITGVVIDGVRGLVVSREDCDRVRVEVRGDEQRHG